MPEYHIHIYFPDMQSPPTVISSNSARRPAAIPATAVEAPPAKDPKPPKVQVEPQAEAPEVKEEPPAPEEPPQPERVIKDVPTTADGMRAAMALLTNKGVSASILGAMARSILERRVPPEDRKDPNTVKFDDGEKDPAIFSEIIDAWEAMPQ